MGAATIVIAAAAVGAALLAAMNGAKLTQTPDSRPPPSAARADLARCRALGPDGSADPYCQATWAAQRERFFGTTAVHAPAKRPGETGR
ncbi:putative entry exclusion protein TrbK-alt [Brevundimonas sp. 1080]|uniref:putative entry exclusion protein TrbK-alt n=1 Tax=Brevundimonas sp. 1080 TaxID=3156405 RepID=UPI00339B693D